jgi:F-type H+-transporting ATPase subunit delta
MSAVARRYAKALFDLAAAAELREQIARELSDVEAVAASPEIAPIWNNPRLGPEQRRAIAVTLQQQLGLCDLLGKFLEYLASVKRLREIPAIRRAFEELLDAALRRTRAVFRSALPLDEGAVERLRNRFAALTEKEVLAQTVVDPELLGGIVVEIDGKTFDGSLRTQLARLAARLAGSASH